ncbi:MAG: hypothetical protein KKC14_03895 [Alphaproteobacteria bacterium]|nr:hypothetical protein [Alphaproteobacteria bacterium]
MIQPDHFVNQVATVTQNLNPPVKGLAVTLAAMSGGDIVVFACGALPGGPGTVLPGLSWTDDAGEDSALARR